MPTSIPFDSSLVLGHSISDNKIEALQAIATAQSEVDNAESDLNALLQAQLTLNATIAQVESLGVTVDSAAQTALQEEIVTSATNLVQVKTKAYGKDGTVTKAKRDASTIINVDLESPLDFTSSQIQSLPFSSNSITLDSQYFSYDSNSQESQSHVADVKSFVAASVSAFGFERSGQITTAAGEQVSRQLEKHDVVGTLVISCATTFEDAKVFDPIVLDSDKAIRVWNELYPAEAITGSDVAYMQDLLQNNTNTTDAIKILSGMTTGSSFVGMVHVIRSESTAASEEVTSVSTSLQAKMKTGAWFAKMGGGFGVDATFANDVRRLLSTQEISSHCSLVCMGLIPSIKSSEVQIGVKAFADFDPADMMEKLTTLANTTTKQSENLDEAAEAARTGKKMVGIRSEEIKAVISGLGEIDDGANQILDINTLMTAFEDYVGKATSGEAGVPINFYVTSFFKADIINAWIDERYPDGPPSPDEPEEVPSTANPTTSN